MVEAIDKDHHKYLSEKGRHEEVVDKINEIVEDKNIKEENE